MIYDFITENYEKGEPIFLSELPGKSKDYLRQEMKRLVDDGLMERLQNGVYYLPYTTILGTKGRISIETYIKKKYTKADNQVSGYITGLQLVNRYGFTTQNPSCYEICSNEATTKQRKIVVDEYTIIVYKPIVPITEKNKSAMQFLDLMSVIDKYTEIEGSELAAKLRKFTDVVQVDFNIVKELLPLYPDRVYRNIYDGGLMSELV